MIARTAVESVTPAGPKRKAAQMRAGKVRYVRGACALTASAASAATEQIRSAPSTVQIRLQADLGSRSQVRMSGKTTRAPAVSPSSHVRQNVGTSELSMTPPASIEIVPAVALMAVAAPTARISPLTCDARSSAARGPIRRRSSHAPTMTSAMLPACWPIRLPSGRPGWSRCNSVLTRSSPRKIPGHQPRPKRYRAAMPSPAGGQIAATEAV
jgi:hypothetical protein